MYVFMDCCFGLENKKVPFLVPSVEVKFQAKVESINSSGLADVIRVIVLRKKQAQPILVAMINMPPSEVVF